MNEDNIDMMLPEDALNRFQQPDTALLGLDISDNAHEKQRYGFKISGIGFLISSETPCEVMKNFIVYPIPKMKQWLHGLVNLRGNLIPVYDMSMLLGLSDEPMNHENLLIIDKGTESAGILLDTLPQPFDISEWQEISYTPKLPAGLSECVSNAYSIEDVLWIEFNHKDYFNSLMDRITDK